MATVILGGGIIGLSIAFYLSELEPELAANHQIHVLDSASELFLSASGYAGGFLAKDWFSSAVASLGELSFRLHKELADAHDGPRNWAYAPSMVYSLAVQARGVGGKRSRDGDWLIEGASRAGVARVSGDNDSENAIGEGADSNEMLNGDGTPAYFTQQKGYTLEPLDLDGNCAQIVPKQLCEWLLSECEARGVKVQTACTATGILKDAEGKVEGMKVKKDTEIYEMRCKNIVIAAGAWTPHVFLKLFPDSELRIPVSPLAGYSIVVRSPRLTKPILDPSRHAGTSLTGVSYAVYCSPTPNWAFAPETFSRVPTDGRPEIWAGGLNDSTLQLPDSADKTVGLKDEEKARELRSAMVAMTGLSSQGDNLNIDDLEIVKEGLCFRPISSSGYPIISQVPASRLGDGIELVDGGGLYIASGHGPWGISLSLGTGKVMAEILTDRRPSADISRLTVS